MQSPGTKHVLGVSNAQMVTLRRAGKKVTLDDGELYSADYQSKTMQAVRDAAGSAFSDIVGWLRDALLRPPWFALVRNLPIDEAAPILVSLSSALGELVEPYRQSWSRVVRHIIPERDRIIDGRVLNESLHTDGTDWPIPNDYTCLFCVCPDQHRQGRSRLLETEKLLNDLSSKAEEHLVETFSTTPVPWRLADELGGGAVWAPPLSLDPLGIRWLRHTNVLAVHDGVATVEQTLLHKLDQLEILIENCDSIVDFQLSAGDALFVDNSRCMHARTSILNPEQSKRRMLRTKVRRRATDEWYC